MDLFTIILVPILDGFCETKNSFRTTKLTISLSSVDTDSDAFRCGFVALDFIKGEGLKRLGGWGVCLIIQCSKNFTLDSC